MKAVVVSNQRGGVGKTTTAVNMAGYLAKRGRRVLLVDADGQGSVGTFLGLKPERFLANFVIHKEALNVCVTHVNGHVDGHLDVLCSNRTTHEAERVLDAQVARETALEALLGPVTQDYDWVIVDVAPSITLLTTCAVMFAGNVVVPVAMDVLSLQGAQTSVQTVQLLNQLYRRNIKVAAFLPTNVNSRLQMTQTVTGALEMYAAKVGVPILNPIRQDQSVPKAIRAKAFLFDFDEESRAAQDYVTAFDQLVKIIEEPHGEAQTA